MCSNSDKHIAVRCYVTVAVGFYNYCATLIDNYCGTIDRRTGTETFEKKYRSVHTTKAIKVTLKKKEKMKGNEMKMRKKKKVLFLTWMHVIPLAAFQIEAEFVE
jgi:hypothetical protein